MSAVTPWAASARSMPTCIEPKLPPPAKTKAVFPRPDRAASAPPRNAAKSVMAARTVRPQLSRHAPTHLSSLQRRHREPRRGSGLFFALARRPHQHRWHAFEEGNVVVDGHGGQALWHQFVTARFGDQDGRAGGVLLDLLPQPIDMRLKGVGGDAGVIAPDLLQQRLARDRTLAGTIEISQDRGLLLREPHLVALGIEQDLRARPERIGADGEHGVLAGLVLAQL